MVRVCKLLLVVLSFLLLGGCGNLSWSTAGKIVPPVNNVCPLEGKWSVLQDLQTDGQSRGGGQQWVGDIAQFTPGVAMLGGYVWNSPTYKIKKVNSTDYLMTKYLALSSTLVPNNHEVDVTTVSTAENFLGDFMKIDDTKIIAFVQNDVLLLQKVSDQVDSSLAATNLNVFDINNQSKAGTSGVMLGLKVPQNNDFTYQTLWLAADNKNLHQVLTGNNIFFPRSSGFWELQVHNVLNGADKEDVVSAHDVSTKVSKIQSLNIKIIQQKAQNKIHKRIIDYVGNDYVAIENDIDGIDQMQVLPVDKITSQVRIKVSDLLQNSGFIVYNNARAQARRILSNEGITPIDEDEFMENFGLTRKNGHWYLQGRINYQNEGAPHYMDYNVNLIPPAKLIFYDTLCLSWQNIKDRVPDAVDAFTSPNHDIALVMTKTNLFVYGLSAEHLDSEPLAKLEMKEGESVIMAEWATGSYVDNWEKAFLANGAKVMISDNLR